MIWPMFAYMSSSVNQQAFIWLRQYIGTASPGPTVMLSSGYDYCQHSLFASTYFFYPWRDGQAELAQVAG